MKMTSAAVRDHLPSLAVLLLSWASLFAQCTVSYGAGGHHPAADGPVRSACKWDPDGPGPQGEVAVLVGEFDLLGPIRSPGIATFDPVTGSCTTLAAPGVTPATNALHDVIVLSNNDLIVTGAFTQIGGVPANNIARFDGVAWHALGFGVPWPGRAVLELPNGDLVVGGAPAGPAGAGPHSVMRWDGATWTSVGGGFTGKTLALARLANGDLVAGGIALRSGGENLMRWDGAYWSPLGGDVDGVVFELLTEPNGDLLVGGIFPSSGGVATGSLARWDGNSWSGFGSGFQSEVHALTVLPNGDLLVGGGFIHAGGVPANRVARWDGVSWHAYGDGVGYPYTQLGYVDALLTFANGEILAVGEFSAVGSDSDHAIWWDGGQWQQLVPGTGGQVLDALETADGDLVVVGEFTRVEGVAVRRIARRSNGVWQPLGSGGDDVIRAVAELPGGDLVVGGDFTSIGGVAANYVARWDGANWSPIGSGVPGPVSSVVVDGMGQVLAAGSFPDVVVFWDGAAWNGTGVAALPYYSLPVPKLSRTSDGGVCAVLRLSYYVSFCSWSGFDWNPLFVTNAYPTSRPVELEGGDLVVVFDDTVKRWDGTTLVALGGDFDGRGLALLALPGGDLLVGGGFASNSGVAMPGLARWDDATATWNAIGQGVAGTVTDLQWLRDGSVLFTGDFNVVDGEVVSSFASLVPSCPATASIIGSGCAGSGGANELTAVDLPWLDATFHSTAKGMPDVGLAVTVLGLGTATTPLAPLLPQAGASCELYTSPDALGLDVPSAGELDLALGIPIAPALIGGSLRQQVVAFELDATGVVVDVTASNALELTIGHF